MAYRQVTAKAFFAGHGTLVTIKTTPWQEMVLAGINFTKNFALRYRKFLLLPLGFGVGTALFIGVWTWWVNHYYQNFIQFPTEIPSGQVAIVFGARVYPNGRLSAMLQDRVETAVQLYKNGKVDKLLLSGDNRFDDYNEPGRMMDYAIAQGIPAKDIQLDYAGRRTYDTCYRAGYIFQLRSAVLITQNFHLPRALFICRNLGVDAVGVTADRQTYQRRSIRWSTLREIPATIIALFDVIRQQPAPVLGDPIPISHR